jgi:argininosuccinate lyase
VRRQRMVQLAREGFAAGTELAAVVHRRTDLSARAAHRVVGNLVLRASKRGLRAPEVDAALLNESAREVIGRDLPELDDEAVRAALDPVAFVDAHALAGGPAPEAVRAAVGAARRRLDEHARGTARDARAALQRAHLELDRAVGERRRAVA